MLKRFQNLFRTQPKSPAILFGLRLLVRPHDKTPKGTVIFLCNPDDFPQAHGRLLKAFLQLKETSTLKETPNETV